MNEPQFDVLTIGNAIVDIISKCEDDFLVNNEIIKAAMNLIDEDRAEALYAAMGPAIETSGGSAGNTAAGLASLGASVAYFGKVADDHLGDVFRHDTRAIGVHFETESLKDSLNTARSMIFVTPDGERSMNTYLGACTKMTPADVDAEVVGASGITYFEGYLWDPEDAKAAIRETARIAHQHDRKVAMSLSDSFCVDRFREEFLELIRTKTVDIVFANDAEVKSLYQTSSFDSAISAIREDCALSIITRGSEGSTVVTREQTSQVKAYPIKELIDTTGAGDLFASGFLFGLARDFDMETCARLGGLCAAEVIQHIGPRPQVSLKQLAEQNGFAV